MYKEVLATIIENLAKERLDDIAFQSDEYVKADEEAKENLKGLRGMLNKEQAAALEEYLESASYREVLYSEIGYRQGMKDFVALMLSLVDF